MERETTTFETPYSRQKIEIKTYLIGREKRALTNVFLSGEFNFSVETQEMKAIDQTILEKSQELAWKTIIVSIDGNVDGQDGFDVVSAILGMRSNDYEAVVAHVNAITNDKSFSEKKTT